MLYFDASLNLSLVYVFESFTFHPLLITCSAMKEWTNSPPLKDTTTIKCRRKCVPNMMAIEMLI